MTEWFLSTSVLILVFLLLRRLLRGRIRPRLQAALWLIVLVRLLLPVSLFGSSFSVGSTLQALPGYEQAAEAVQEVAAPITEPTIVLKPVDPMAEQAHQLSPDELQTLQTPLRISILSLIWICGSLLMAIYTLWRNLAFRHHLYQHRIIQPDYNAQLPVYAVPGLPTPCLFWRRVYLPLELTDLEAQRHAVAHEVAHALRHDDIWNAVRCALCVIYWWHPLVWISAIASRTDMELACDEAAIAALGESERVAYGRTLVDLVHIRALPGSPHLLATTMVSGAGTFKTRIRTIAAHPTTRRWAAAILCIVLVLTCFVTFSGAASERRDGVANSFIRGGIRGENGWDSLPEQTLAPVAKAIDSALWLPMLSPPSGTLDLEIYFYSSSSNTTYILERYTDTYLLNVEKRHSRKGIRSICYQLRSDKLDRAVAELLSGLTPTQNSGGVLADGSYTGGEFIYSNLFQLQPLTNGFYRLEDHCLQTLDPITGDVIGQIVFQKEPLSELPPMSDYDLQNLSGYLETCTIYPQENASGGDETWLLLCQSDGTPAMYYSESELLCIQAFAPISLPYFGRSWVITDGDTAAFFSMEDWQITALEWLEDSVKLFSGSKVVQRFSYYSYGALYCTLWNGNFDAQHYWITRNGDQLILRNGDQQTLTLERSE